MSTLKFNQWLNTDNTENYKCRAWVNFNGTGTVAIRASGNVSSITDNGTGDYTVNFSTAMPNTSYAVTGLASSGMQANFGTEAVGINTLNTGSVRVIHNRADGNAFDTDQFHIAVFR